MIIDVRNKDTWLDQGFFSKFLMGGTQNFRSPLGTKSDGGGTCEKNPTEAKTAHLMQI